MLLSSHPSAGGKGGGFVPRRHLPHPDPVPLSAHIPHPLQRGSLLTEPRGKVSLVQEVGRGQTVKDGGGGLQRLEGSCLGPKAERNVTCLGDGSGGGKVIKSPEDDSRGLCVPRCGGRVWQGSGCCGQAGAWQRLWGRTQASAVTPGGAGAGAEPAAPQGSLLILPTARSSAAQTSLAQRRGPGAAGLAGRKLPLSLCPSPETTGAASGLPGKDNPKRSVS